ncbi:MAG: hypothetical protein K0Q56_2287 [Sporolactobacillus laevolacticus]|jgi:hypothetical protein|nr:hypothetical protein [Sporolactobacillus laevolacticus]
MKRFVIECIVILSLLLLCMLYGAVTVRDAQHPQTASQSTGTVFQTQKIVVPKSNEQTSEGQETVSNPPAKTVENGYSLSEKVQRFFLLVISAIAEVVDGLIQVFA